LDAIPHQIYRQHPQTWSCLQETCLAFNLPANIGLYCEGFYCLDIDNEIPHVVEDAMLTPEMNFTSRPPMLPSTDTLNDSELSSLVRNKDDTLYKLAWCLNSCLACDIQARDGDIYCSETVRKAQSLFSTKRITATVRLYHLTNSSRR
jgi:hypothetical protein